MKQSVLVPIYHLRFDRASLRGDIGGNSTELLVTTYLRKDIKTHIFNVHFAIDLMMFHDQYFVLTFGAALFTSGSLFAFCKNNDHLYIEKRLSFIECNSLNIDC